MVVVGLGLASRRYAEYIPDFLSLNTGDALWTVAVYLAMAIAIPACRPLTLGIIALSLSFAVEFSQLVNLPSLNLLRQTLLGRLIMGSGFLWIDLLRYVAGAAIAVVIELTWIGWRRRP